MMRPTETGSTAYCEIDRLAPTVREVRLVVRGELDMASTDRLGAVLDDLHADGRPAVVDLRSVSFLESTAICALLRAAAAARRDDWTLGIVAPTGFPLRVLELCSADRHLPFVSAD